MKAYTHIAMFSTLVFWMEIKALKITYFACAYLCMCECLMPEAHVEVRGQPAGVSSPCYDYWILNKGVRFHLRNHLKAPDFRFWMLVCFAKTTSYCTAQADLGFALYLRLAWNSNSLDSSFSWFLGLTGTYYHNSAYAAFLLFLELKLREMISPKNSPLLRKYTTLI